MKCSQVVLSSALTFGCVLEQSGDMVKMNKQSSVPVPHVSDLSPAGGCAA